MTQSDFWSEELPANHSLLQDLGKDLKIQEAILLSPMLEFLTTLDPSGSFGKMCQVSLVAGGGRDFGSFLGALGELGYGWSYRVLDAQYFGVAQRRRRVFVVGHLGDWRPTAEVLFESESLQRNTKPSRKARKSVTGYVESSFGQYREDVVAGTTKASGGVLSGGSETFIVGALDTECGGQKLSHQSINSGHIFAVYENHPSDSRVKEMGEVCQTVTSKWGTGGGNVPFVQSFGWQNSPSQSMSVDSITPTLDKSKTPAITYSFDSLASNRMKSPNPNSGCRQVELSKTIDTTYPCPSKNQGGIGIMQNMAVRRLTPVECERLQGFPDNYTNIKESCPDGPRYKAMGNSMAVPVMRWIGERINGLEHGNTR